MIREKFETIISVSEHHNPFGQQINGVLFDENLDSESGNQGSHLNCTVNKLYNINKLLLVLLQFSQLFYEVVGPNVF